MTVKYEDRIRKLLATAEHPDTPEGESEAAMMQAQKLMLKHAIDEAKVRAAAAPQTRKPPIKRLHDVMPAHGRTGIKAMRHLLYSVASTNRVRVVKYNPQSNPTHVLVGFESDVIFVISLYESLVRQMRAAFERTSLSSVTERKEFCWGFVTRVTQRLASAMDREERQLTEGSAETLLVLRTRTHEVDTALSRYFPRLGTASFGKYGQSDARAKAQGSEAGSRASLTGARGEI